ncbi:twin-arginine translocation signal domain-containing protein [Halapricum desulfuricans]|uniref:Twin-arginine translocation signal domain-containing protein n=1 Tax=Halapricum desulfuricans TaxID=2841257 RepID=A0A897NYJ0_9EURY|nr:twin-arginine translocation signal domain-containing protein [Halapricum desulfuricans]QSG15803.1 Uncharacterized protein HSEST_2291 [Halapricum desulfuricans]
MRRRRFLTGAATGAVVGTAGCIGGEVILTKDEMVPVPPEDGRIFELPSDGDEIEYIARDDRPFSVYVFGSDSALEAYKMYIDEDEETPDDRPSGVDSLSKRTVMLRGSPDELHEASTENKGREPLNVDGTGYLVLDNSNYESDPSANDERLTVQLTLKVVSSTLPI